MKGKRVLAGAVVAILLALAAGLSLAQLPEGTPLGTAFTYQGYLESGGQPVDDPCDLQFALWDAETGGAQIGPLEDRGDVDIRSGLFTVKLDFATGSFQGEARWLEIAVQCPGDPGYTTLAPRQALTPAPYALALPGLWTEQMPDGSTNLIGGRVDNWVTDGAVGAVIGGGGEPGNPNRVTDSHGTVGGGAGNQAGNGGDVTDDAPCATVAGGAYNAATGFCSAIGGGESNTAAARDGVIAGGSGNSVGGEWAAIGGGIINEANGLRSTVAGGEANVASQPWCTIGGGAYNLTGGAGTDSATVSGGHHNTADGHVATIGGGCWNSAAGMNATVSGGITNTATAHYSTVGGGRQNRAEGVESLAGGGWNNLASGIGSTVAGGHNNVASNDVSTVGGGNENESSGVVSTVGGGEKNTASGVKATVSGGDRNTASGNDATVSGGITNTASLFASTVGGGQGNQASGDLATIAGGDINTASAYASTVAGGGFNVASGERSTIGGGMGNTAGSQDSTVAGGLGNAASGSWSAVGGGWDNIASGTFATIPGGSNNRAQGDHSFAAGSRTRAYNQGCFVWGDTAENDVVCDVDNLWVARASGGVAFLSSADNGNGVFLSPGGNSWSGISDRALKENLSPTDGQAILETLASLPVQEYNLKSQDASIRHIGLVAQDFASFGYGESDTAINMQDADGVALAAIQGLYVENQALKAQLAGMEARLASLEQGTACAQPARTGAQLPVPWLAVGGLVVATGALAGWRRRPGGRR